jgi:CHAD domain-containing protein
MSTTTTEQLRRPDDLSVGHRAITIIRPGCHRPRATGRTGTTTGAGARCRGPAPVRTVGPVSAGEVVLEALRTQVARLRAQEPRVRRGVPGSVTLMRVATRQLRSTLRGFSRILAPARTRVVADELKWLAAQLADENDTEVLIERFTRNVRALPEYLIHRTAAGADLERALRRLDAQGEQTIHTALHSARYLALQDMLEHLLAQPPLTRRAGKPAASELPKNVAKAFHELQQRLDALEATAPGPRRDEALHEARKADKRVRYMTQIVAPVVGRPARRLRRQTKKLQDLLGEYQDTTVARPALRQLAAAARADGRSQLTYGLLHAIEEARAQRVLRKLPNRVEHLRDERTVAWLHPAPSARRDRYPVTRLADAAAQGPLELCRAG